MPYEFQVVVDSQRPHELAGWWAETLGWRDGVALHTGAQGPHTWTTIADPEGNEFCVS